MSKRLLEEFGLLAAVELLGNRPETASDMAALERPQGAVAIRNAANQP